MTREKIELLLKRYLSPLIVHAVLGYIDGQRAEIERLKAEKGDMVNRNQLFEAQLTIMERPRKE